MSKALTPDEKRRRRLIISLQDAPVRTCHALLYCQLCGGEIQRGDTCCDRGHERRAHYRCVPGRGKDREPWMREGPCEGRAEP